MKVSFWGLQSLILFKMLRVYFAFFLSPYLERSDPRQPQLAPRLRLIRKYLERIRSSSFPQSLMGQAITFALNQWSRPALLTLSSRTANATDSVNGRALLYIEYLWRVRPDQALGSAQLRLNRYFYANVSTPITVLKRHH